MKNLDYDIIFSDIIPTNDIIHYLADEDIKYINKFNNQKIKDQSATGRYLIRKYLKDNFPTSYNEYKIVISETGKPYFENSNTLFFSISHSKMHVAVIFSKLNCAIDIENIKTYKREIAARFFHQNEYDYLESINDKYLQADEFYRIWTVKEAYLKLKGSGIAGGLSTFYIDENGYIKNSSDMIENCTIISEKKILGCIPYYYTIII